MKFKAMIYILPAIVLLAVLAGFIPMKQAIKRGGLDKSGNYIIVKVQKATLSEWIAIGDNNGNYDTPKNVRLTGNAPFGYNYNVEVGDNTFVCYGKDDGVGFLQDEKYETFNAERWEILYPVKRNSLFDWILPDSYLCRFDRGR